MKKMKVKKIKMMKNDPNRVWKREKEEEFLW